ncbi:hypothetical protein [Legionella waltersii]|uniref:Uncharacterized protein n=1 Tax=Legionella waltersii TaxID=66969 RepID=A0A0W1A1S5_9GAMM|nr:hypothetical protein [Legionella waltersii]KTD74963.1 hypothetical protein Lwal_3004 [Legionella waltersii]SNV08451.1 Uncharacterised protein [Legionella waltersii]
MPGFFEENRKLLANARENGNQDNLVHKDYLPLALFRTIQKEAQYNSYLLLKEEVPNKLKLIWENMRLNQNEDAFLNGIKELTQQIIQVPEYINELCPPFHMNIPADRDKHSIFLVEAIARSLLDDLGLNLWRAANLGAANCPKNSNLFLTEMHDLLFALMKAGLEITDDLGILIMHIESYRTDMNKHNLIELLQEMNQSGFDYLKVRNFERIQGVLNDYMKIEADLNPKYPPFFQYLNKERIQEVKDTLEFIENKKSENQPRFN